MEQTRITVKYRIKELSPKRRTTDWIITAIPPKKGSNYYGTGYYITATPIKDNGEPDDDAAIHWDMRYACTIDINELADIWVRDYYGGKITKKVKYYVA